MTESSGSGWGEYQKLVLAELERHNKWLNVIDSKLNQALVSFTLSQQLIQNLSKSHEDLLSMAKDHESRIENLEKDMVSKEAVRNYETSRKSDRRWIIGLAIATTLSVLGLIVNLIFNLIN